MKIAECIRKLEVANSQICVGSYSQNRVGICDHYCVEINSQSRVCLTKWVALGQQCKYSKADGCFDEIKMKNKPDYQ